MCELLARLLDWATNLVFAFPMVFPKKDWIQPLAISIAIALVIVLMIYIATPVPRSVQVEVIDWHSKRPVQGIIGYTPQSQNVARRMATDKNGRVVIEKDRLYPAKTHLRQFQRRKPMFGDPPILYVNAEGYHPVFDAFPEGEFPKSVQVYVEKADAGTPFRIAGRFQWNY